MFPKAFQGFIVPETRHQSLVCFASGTTVSLHCISSWKSTTTSGGLECNALSAPVYKAFSNAFGLRYKNSRTGTLRVRTGAAALAQSAHTNTPPYVLTGSFARPSLIVPAVARRHLTGQVLACACVQPVLGATWEVLGLRTDACNDVMALSSHTAHAQTRAHQKSSAPRETPRPRAR